MLVKLPTPKILDKYDVIYYNIESEFSYRKGMEIMELKEEKNKQVRIHLLNVGYARVFQGMVEEAYLGPDPEFAKERAVFERFFVERGIPTPTSEDDLHWVEKTTLVVDFSNPTQAVLIMAAVCRALEKYTDERELIPNELIPKSS